MRPTSGVFPNEDLEVRIEFVVKGSTRTDDIEIASEELQIKARHGAFLLRLEAGEIRTDYKGAPGFYSVLQQVLPAVARIGAVPKDPASDLQRNASERVREFPEGWLFVPRLLPRPLTRELQVARLRLDSTTLRSYSVTSDRHLGIIGPAGEGLALAVDRLRGHGNEPTTDFKELLVQLTEVYPRIEDVRPLRIQPGRLILTFKERGIVDPLARMIHAAGS